MQGDHTGPFQPELPALKGCARTSAQGHVQTLHTTLRPRWQVRGEGRVAALGTEIRSLSSAAAPPPRAPPPRAPPPPSGGALIKQPRAACQESLCSRAPARASPLSDPRRKLSFASEPKWVSFYWPERHQAGGTLLGTHSAGLVTHSLPLASLFLLPGHLGHLFCSSLFFRLLKATLAVS